MEQPTYLRRLLNQKVLLIIGFVVAVAAGLLAGFTVEDGQIEPRADRSYMASSTVLLTSPQPDYFQVEIPGETTALPQSDDPEAQEVVVQDPTPINLSDSAIILAYMASSDEVATEVAARIGDFEDGEGISAVRRTTQPAGDEQFGGRLTLPIIDIVGVATSAERAEEIAAVATTVFGEMVLAQQEEWGVAEDIRLSLDELNAPVAGDPEGGNPAIPVVVVTVGVFLLFVALALIIEAVRDRRRRRTGSDEDDVNDDAGADDEDDVPHEHADEVPEPVEERQKELVGAGSAEAEAAPRSRRRRSAHDDFDELLNRDDAASRA
ncbi:MAG TPA: hypothetical protein DCS84_02770 [Microbacterium sp.]|nr:hypothetical protein [Microbacterium sp.]